MPKLTCWLVAVAAILPVQSQVEVRGTHSNPKPFCDTGARLDEYGINAVFVHGGKINDDLVRRARAEGAKVFAEFATLNGKGYVDEHPEAWPINEKGEKSPPATWFMGVCPTEPNFRAFRMKQLEDLLDRHDIDGVWIETGMRSSRPRADMRAAFPFAGTSRPAEPSGPTSTETGFPT